MLNPERFEGGIPEVREKAQLVARQTRNLIQLSFFADRFFEKYPRIGMLGARLQRHGRWMEQIDPATGDHPSRVREAGFKNGVVAGVIIGEELFPQEFSIAFEVCDDISRELKQFDDPQNPTDEANNKGTYLGELGWRGLRHFPEITEEVDAITDRLHPDINSQTAMKAGMGVALWVAHESWISNDNKQVEYLIQGLEQGELDLDAQFVGFFGDTEPE